MKLTIDKVDMNTPGAQLRHAQSIRYDAGVLLTRAVLQIVAGALCVLAGLWLHRLAFVGVSIAAADFSWSVWGFARCWRALAPRWNLLVTTSLDADNKETHGALRRD